MKTRTATNRQIGNGIRQGIEVAHKTGKDDRAFKQAQIIGHRKPYSGEEIIPDKRNVSAAYLFKKPDLRKKESEDGRGDD